jgi:uncharacterized protein YbaP (TraB family)
LLPGTGRALAPIVARAVPGRRQSKVYPNASISRAQVRRNQRWAGQIEALLDDDRDYLVVVGALHLVGPDGLPNLLRDRGLTVTRH